MPTVNRGGELRPGPGPGAGLVSTGQLALVLRVQAALNYNRFIYRLTRLPLLGACLARHAPYGRMRGLRLALNIFLPLIRQLGKFLLLIGFYVVASTYAVQAQLLRSGAGAVLDSLSPWSFIGQIPVALLDSLTRPQLFSQVFVSIYLLIFTLNACYGDNLIFQYGELSNYLIRHLRLPAKGLLLTFAALKILRRLVLAALVLLGLRALGLLQLPSLYLLALITASPLAILAHDSFLFAWQSPRRHQPKSKFFQIAVAIPISGLLLAAYFLLDGRYLFPSWVFLPAAALGLVLLGPALWILVRRQDYRSFYLFKIRQVEDSMAELEDSSNGQLEIKSYLDTVGKVKADKREEQTVSPARSQAQQSTSLLSPVLALPLKLAQEKDPYLRLEHIWTWRSRHYLLRKHRIMWGFLCILSLAVLGLSIYAFVVPSFLPQKEIGDFFVVLPIVMLYLRQWILSVPIEGILKVRYNVADAPLLTFAFYRRPDLLTRLFRARLRGLLWIYRWHFLAVALISLFASLILYRRVSLAIFLAALCLLPALIVLSYFLELYARLRLYFFVSPQPKLNFLNGLNMLTVPLFFGLMQKSRGIYILSAWMLLSAPLALLAIEVYRRFRRSDFCKRPSAERS